MRYITMFLFFSASLILSGCSKMSAESIEYLPTQGETVTIISNPDAHPLRRSMEMFPKEIYLGDPVYFVTYRENTSPETVSVPGSYYPGGYSSKQLTLSSTEIQEGYHWTPEDSSRNLRSIILREIEFQPGKKFSEQAIYLEFPPLEDWDAPFWKELREKMPPEGMTCKLTFMRNTHQDILIKPRPANEMALLEKWYKNTPEKLFSKDDGYNIKWPQDTDHDLISSGKSDIVINGNKYDPWMFIRLGNRKPSDPNNPTTLDGWRKLEASLVPSTMRDEVRLTRLQLEYYSAAKGEASDNAKQELVEWLKSLPEPQRSFMLGLPITKMIYFTYSRENREKPSPLSDKNRELIRSLYDMFDPVWQEHICNSMVIHYNDRSLTPPEGAKIIRLLMEILEPTTEDLALNSKELPDGFRIWDAVGDVGPVRMVAQFVELKESEDRVILKHRENGNVNLTFSALSEEDKQYAREQQKKLAEVGVE